MLTAKQISCSSCGEDFVFTVEEQEFYQSRGFQDPKKCKPCRDAAKQNRNRAGGYSGSRGGYGQARRQLYDVVCSGCGVATQVPFQPNGTKPVYCRECYQNNSTYY